MRKAFLGQKTAQQSQVAKNIPKNHHSKQSVTKIKRSETKKKIKNVKLMANKLFTIINMKNISFI